MFSQIFNDDIISLFLFGGTAIAKVVEMQRRQVRQRNSEARRQREAVRRAVPQSAQLVNTLAGIMERRASLWTKLTQAQRATLNHVQGTTPDSTVQKVTKLWLMIDHMASIMVAELDVLNVQRDYAGHIEPTLHGMCRRVKHNLTIDLLAVSEFADMVISLL